MGADIFLSGHTERLANALIDGLRNDSSRPGADPLRPARVIVPNWNLEKWLKLRIAKRVGIAANVDFKLLERGFFDLLTGVSVGPAADKRDLLDSATLQQMLLAVMLNASDDDKPLRPVLDYLGDHVSAQSSDRSRRAWKLSDQLAVNFMEYQNQRPNLITAWIEGVDNDQSEIEACQRELYRRVLGHGGLRDRLARDRGAPLMTLVELADTLSRSQLEPPPADAPLPTVHVFGFHLLSRVFYQHLLQLGDHYNLRLYQLSFYRTLADDDATLPVFGVERTDGGESLVADALHPLLKLWGQAGRDNLHLLRDWMRQTGAGRAHWLDDEPVAEPPTMLNRLRARVLRNESTPLNDGASVRQDTSLQIAGCPSVFREVETVRASILRNLAADPSLNQTDIAVLATDMRRYAPVITAVFGREPTALRYNLSDSTSGSDSLFARAVDSLLALAESAFTRREVFDLIVNPCFLARFGLTRLDARAWLDWADKLNVFRGFGAANDASVRAFTWSQGLRRLRLGRIMTSDDQTFRGLAPYDDIAGGNEDAVGEFGLVVEDLYRRLSALRSRDRDCGEWATRLGSLVDDFLAAPDDEPQEDVVRRRFYEGLNRWNDFDAILAAGNTERYADTGRRVDYSLVAEATRAGLSDIPSRQGRYLTDGVTISSLRPLRPIPFKIVYILGLDEGVFPGSEARSTFDLRRRERLIGDVSVPENNRYLFLETLLSTRQKLYLTYVSHDLQKDEKRLPCSLVNQLLGYIEEHELPSGTMFERYVMPLSPSSVKVLMGHDFDGRSIDAGKCDLLVGDSRFDRTLCLASGLRDGSLRLTDEQQRRLSGHIARNRDQLRPPATDTQAPPTTVRLDIRDLARFLRNPVEALLRHRLELWDEDTDDPGLAEDEPFYSDALDNYGLLSSTAEQCLERSLERGELIDTNEARRLFDETFASLQNRGDRPEAAFGELDRDSRWRCVEKMLTNASLADYFSGGEVTRTATLGMRVATDPREVVFPATTLDVTINTDGEERVIEVELTGAQSFVRRDTSAGATDCASVTVGAGTYTGKKSAPDKRVVEPYLFYLAALAGHVPNIEGLVASEWIGDKPFDARVLYREGFGRWIYHADREQARKYLTDLAREFIEGEGFDLLPLEAKSMKAAIDADDSPAAALAFAEQLRDEVGVDRENSQSSIRMSPLIEMADCSVPDDALAKAKRRLAAEDGASLLRPKESDFEKTK